MHTYFFWSGVFLNAVIALLIIHWTYESYVTRTFRLFSLTWYYHSILPGNPSFWFCFKLACGYWYQLGLAYGITLSCRYGTWRGYGNWQKSEAEAEDE